VVKGAEDAEIPRLVRTAAAPETDVLFLFLESLFPRFDGRSHGDGLGLLLDCFLGLAFILDVAVCGERLGEHVLERLQR